VEAKRAIKILNLLLKHEARALSASFFAQNASKRDPVHLSCLLRLVEFFRWMSLLPRPTSEAEPKPPSKPARSCHQCCDCIQALQEEEEEVSHSKLTRSDDNNCIRSTATSNKTKSKSRSIHPYPRHHGYYFGAYFFAIALSGLVWWGILHHPGTHLHHDDWSSDQFRQQQSGRRWQ